MSVGGGSPPWTLTGPPSQFGLLTDLVTIPRRGGATRNTVNPVLLIPHKTPTGPPYGVKGFVSYVNVVSLQCPGLEHSFITTVISASLITKYSKGRLRSESASG